MPVDPKLFKSQIGVLFDAFSLNMKSVQLTADQEMRRAGASDALNGRGCFCKSSSWGSLHPFQQMVNTLLDKGIISTTDTMASLSDCLVRNRGMIDKKTADIIFIAAERSGLLTQDPKKFIEVLKAAKVGFYEVISENEKASVRKPSKKMDTTSNTRDEGSTSSFSKVPSSNGLSLSSSRETSPVSPPTSSSLMDALRRVSEMKGTAEHQRQMKVVFEQLKAGEFPETVQYKGPDPFNPSK